ncbi:MULTISPECIES: BCCT family transporter [Pasteurellaceae]|uniref:BCCT family transporter n=1 Tax=Pasteurella atlantica TaxID=2827233 RepID=A0AAW8CFQ7_9PAST|nr:BCCT family transporter [Pasteurella atlantica]MBR0572765.1 BCCT family transporter [Pasteurella atlantica]MDP8038693.1 BCCT family transporter [Pasteurella atlantica]MDP8040785.1 BCCT family transporter [Pasteurella atlantica]MDP8043042.1 BCCT family transporter [Pasteurella atlantica]MDP8045128.1 BCCT family transporter [Pasteurella atlantica]
MSIYFNKGSRGIIVIGIIVLIFLLFPHNSIHLVAQFTLFCIDTFGLGIILFATLMLFLAIAISLSPIGSWKIGHQNTKPEFGFFSWLAMLFTCGMGSGLIFWGIAEPLFHFSNMPLFAQQYGHSPDTALALTYFHWGFHAWSIYALGALAIAWFSFNRGRSLHISACFTAKKTGLWRIVDWLAITAIIFGLAGTFANSTALVQTGLQKTLLLDIDSVLFRYSFIIILTLLFTASSILGLEKGIKRLSQLNTGLMIAFIIAMFIIFEPLNILSTFFTSIKHYLILLPKVSFKIAPESQQWSLNWSVIYMVWWIAWTPFVAPFIARISKGRSIRQFLCCVIIIPTLASLIWFSAFGGTALSQPYLMELMNAVNQDYTRGLFQFFAHLPFGNYLSLVAILLLITFIITSADSALLVCGILSDNESVRNKILWALLLVILSMALIYINDVDLNKQVAIAGALPFAIVQLAQVMVMFKDMWKQHRKVSGHLVK